MGKFIDFIKNNTIYLNKYKTNSEAVIISCFFNPTNSAYRLKAFNTFYDSIKHLNHKIIECLIGDDAKPQLTESEHISRVYTKSTLWHKEALLNKIISELPQKYKYVYWVDADVIFTNKNWLVEGVKQLETHNVIQPFEYCVHLNKDEKAPSFDMKSLHHNKVPYLSRNTVWRSFCANYKTKDSSVFTPENNVVENWKNENYNIHGHVGFAWGAKREVLEKVPLYDKALVGGADHIIAHAAVGQINHKCITKSFTDNIDDINVWSEKFNSVVERKVSYVKGDLYHIWHGDLEKREYLKRTQEFSKESKKIETKDSNGLYVAEDDSYVKKYFNSREVTNTKPTRNNSYKNSSNQDVVINSNNNNTDDGFLTSMVAGYVTNDALLGSMIGGNVLGGMVGDMLNTSEQNSEATSEQHTVVTQEQLDSLDTQNFS